MDLPLVTTNSLLNLPAPISPGTLLATPVAIPQQQAVNFNTAGGPGYAAAYQLGSPYSATNLPEFMKDYQQTPSGKFVMNQGILGMPPQIDKVQSLFSQGYAQEYQPLEQKFQESFAFDPTMFGDMYRAGQLVPSVPMPTVDQDSGLNPALALAGAGAIKELYPYAEDFVKGLTPDSVPQPELQGPPEQTFAQKFEEKVTQPVKAATIDPVVKAWQESQFKKDADQKILDFKKWADDTFDKPEFINDLQEGAKQYIKDFKESGIIDAGKVGFDAIGNLENFITKPTAVNAYDAIDSIDKINTVLPESMQFKLPDSAADIAGGIGGTLAVGRAFKDPSAENLANAYAGIDELAFQAANKGLIDLAIKPGSSTVLPGAETVGNVASVIGGVKALEGGIESPGEAIAVANAAIAAASMATAGATAGTALAINNAAAAANPYLAAIAAAISLEQILAEDMSLKDVVQSLPVIGRWAGGGGATFGTATLQYDPSKDDFVFESEKSKNKGWLQTMPEMHATNLILNELTDNLGFEIDPNKLKNVDTTINIDSRTEKNRTSNDIVLDMINTGAIKPTANTPNNIDWGNLFTEARKYSSGYTEQKTPGSSLSGIKELQANPSVVAAQAYKTTIPVKTQVGKGYSTVQTPGIISKTGKEVYSKNLTDASYAKFANQDDAFAFASNPENIKKKQLPPTGIKGKTTGKNRYTPGLVEVTYLEVQPDNSLRQKTTKVSPAAAQNFAVSKPAPAPTYSSPMGLGLPNINFAGIDLSGIDWGKINLTI
jgi:hypothetical protein